MKDKPETIKTLRKAFNRQRDLFRGA